MEDIIISGKNNPMIDPQLSVWEWHIPLYLFLGGLAAGLLFFSSFFYLTGKESKMRTAVSRSVHFAPIALIVGLLALFLDLKHKLYFWKLYTSISFESPMSWGAWTLMVITPLSILWSLTFLNKDHRLLSIFDTLKLGKLIVLTRRYRRAIAVVLLLSSVILGVYTGILLSAFNARPLWNTSVLGFLFLISGLSTGAATIILMSKNAKEKHLIVKVDIGLILVELFLIIHLIMGLLAGPEAQIWAVNLLFEGHFFWMFWGLVVVAGLILPLALEWLEFRGKKVPFWLASSLILVGGLLFRIVMVEAGQISGYSF